MFGHPAISSLGSAVCRRASVKTVLHYLAIVATAAALGSCASALVPAPSVPELAEADCHPAPAADLPQYIVGYGSLMQDESRKRTSPQAGPAHPVEVAGYRRGWFARGDSVGFSTTYLGVAADATSNVNAVIYLVEASELTATD